MPICISLSIDAYTPYSMDTSCTVSVYPYRTDIEYQGCYSLGCFKRRVLQLICSCNSNTAKWIRFSWTPSVVKRTQYPHWCPVVFTSNQ